jgi:fibronectin type 3 domain-containing protein
MRPYWCIFFFLVNIAWSFSFMTTVKQDSVFIHIRETPVLGTGYHIERKHVDSDSFERLTDEPLRVIRNEDRAVTVLGDDYVAIAKALKADSPTALLRRLYRSSFRIDVLTMLYRRAGIISGRFFVAGGHRTGEQYIYRVLLIDDEGQVLQSEEKSILIRDHLPEPPANVVAHIAGNGIELKWSYPEWIPDSRDRVIYFDVWRSTQGQPFVRINKEKMLRLSGLDPVYRDDQVFHGETVRYRVTAVDVVRRESEPASTETIHFLDQVPPSAPRNPVAQGGDRNIRVSWQPAPEIDLQGFHVYRAASLQDSAKQITSTLIDADETAYVDSLVSPGKQYFYRVTAVDSAGNPSRFSTAVSAIADDLLPPGRPLQLTSAFEEGQLVLSWEPPDDEDIYGYWVSKGYSNDVQAHLYTKPVKDLMCVDSSRLTPGKHYYYTVQSIDSTENVSEPERVIFQVPDHEPPVSPGSVQVLNKDGKSVSVRWNSSLSLDTESYFLIRSSSGTADTLARLPATQREYSDTRVEKGVVYLYSVIAVDGFGNQSLPAVSEPLRFADFSPPATPRHIYATLEQNNVRITWEPVFDFDIAGYNIYACKQPTGVYNRLNTIPVAERQYIHSEADRLWYVVKCVDTSGNESQGSKPVRVE